MSHDLNPSTYSSLAIFIDWTCGRQESIVLMLRSKWSSDKCAKLHSVAASNSRDFLTRSLYYCLFAPHLGLFVCCSSRTSRSWWIALSTQCRLRICNNILSCLQWTAPLCCDWKAQAASAQNFTLWQQAKIEITGRAHSISACLRRATYKWVLFFRHIPFVVIRTFNTMLTKSLQHLQQVWATLVDMTKSERDK